MKCAVQDQQVLVRPVSGPVYALSVPAHMELFELQQLIEEHDGIPMTDQRITWGERPCPMTLVFDHSVELQVHLRVCGGKGGFGSLLRGSQPGAAKITTTNFGACRDLNGRRIRHVEQERELTEWRQQQQEQEQEKKQQKKHRTEKGPVIELESFAEESEALALSVSDTVQEALKNSPAVSLLPAKRSPPPSDDWNSSAPKRMKGDDLFGLLPEEDDNEDPNPSPALQTKKESIATSQEDQSSQPPAPVASVSTPVPSVTEKEEEEVELLDLGKYGTVEELVQEGPDVLKRNLESRGLKCGGSLQQRAERLFAVRGIPQDQWDRKLLAPKKGRRDKKK